MMKMWPSPGNQPTCWVFVVDVVVIFVSLVLVLSAAHLAQADIKPANIAMGALDLLMPLTLPPLC